ncbi:MAG: hypothetical protein LLG01_07720 [Planctomycetaceae bacterium]|nr:hypothetical protein [Planctomycetaceae bacterium]
MRIDGTSPMDGGLLPPTKATEQGASRAPAAAMRELASAAPAESVPMEYISKASLPEVEDPQKIARIKQLLASGKLDSPQAIVRVAESLAQFGI